MAMYGVSTYGPNVGLNSSQIKNLALFTLGFTEVVNFDDATNPIVSKVNTIYQTTLLFVLSNYPWRFVLKRIALTDRGDVINGKFKYFFSLPANCLAIRCAYGDPKYMVAITEYDSTPTLLYCNSTTAYLWYLAIVDEEEFPQYFIDYFKYRLALDLCHPLTGDSELLKQIAIQEAAMLATAKNIDAKQSQTRTVKHSPFTQIRR